MCLGVLVGKPAKPTGFRWVELVKEARQVLNDGYYLCSEPFTVTDIDNRKTVVGKDELVSFDTGSAVSILGQKYYKVPEKDLFFLKGRACA